MSGGPRTPAAGPGLSRAEIEALARFRLAVRRYLAFAERGAKSVGLTAQQHQALLAVKAWSFSGPMTVGDLAGQMLLKPHSAAELAGRLAKGGFLRRRPSDDDGRVVHLVLTPEGERVLARLSENNLRELRLASPAFETAFEQFSQHEDG